MSAEKRAVHEKVDHTTEIFQKNFLQTFQCTSTYGVLGCRCMLMAFTKNVKLTKKGNFILDISKKLFKSLSDQISYLTGHCKGSV